MNLGALKAHLVLLFLAVAPSGAYAGAGLPSTCERPVAGSVVAPPPDLYSQGGVLNVDLTYNTTVDADNRTLFCFNTRNGLESPTLHVKPGDTLNIALTNRVPALPAGSPAEPVPNSCGAKSMTGTSVNMHFHGTNTSPTCHSDEVVHTLINSGETFHYSVTFPKDEPPGLYWYHPHVHGIAEAAALGGGTGLIVVEGIENLQPAVANLPERLLVIRDQNVASNPNPGGQVPSWDISLNYVPISYPALTPAVIQIAPGAQEFWRVANASADTIADLQLVYDGVPQPLQIVALDGVPTGSQDGTRRGKMVAATDAFIPPAGRAEFIMAAPPANVKTANLITNKIETGPDGDNDTRRVLAVLISPNVADDHKSNGVAMATLPAPSVTPGPQRFESLDRATVTTRRRLYFSEVLQDPTNPSGPTNFYITVDGATPTLFSASNPPAITTTQGAVEEWTIENRARENHEFHLHQIHFQLRERNGVQVSGDERQFYDTIQVPYWSGKGPYPSVTVALDFRGNVVGDFVYHCHILGHEDSGMMATIRVLPQS